MPQRITNTPQFIVNEQAKSIYFPIGRTGSTLIRKAIRHAGWDRFDSDYRDVDTIDEYDGFFKWAVVRNPFERLRSTYGRGIASVNSRRLALEPGVLCHMEFDEFVETIEHHHDYECDIHLNSQAAYIAPNGVMLPDFLLRLEDMERDWPILQAITYVGLQPLSTKFFKKKIPLELSRKTFDAICRRYAKDIELLEVIDDYEYYKDKFENGEACGLDSYKTGGLWRESTT